ncbi:fluoride efflux transporter FluC [Demequina lutea]|uniref:Fluoride-specific ion channel FluC n=1 Tax=Demequina lutea TaxID=431489 RepID=A0A7Y9ZC73_9MICO|nr:CrcB family protein [Demequina lutea]NYI42742.1 CrcB protein [Demequina lutea]
MSDHATVPRRAPYLQPQLLAFVMLGGAAGATARWQVSAAFASKPEHWPWATFAINIVGSLLLGLLLETTLRSGPDAGWRRGIRVGVGTGFLGGFTTYSTFIVETDRLVSTGHLWVGAAYAAVSIIVGVVAAMAGIALARTLRQPRPKAGSAR